MIDLVKQSDISGCIDTVLEYLGESEYYKSVGVSKSRVIDSAVERFFNDDYLAGVYRVDGEVAGLVGIHLNYSWTDDPMAFEEIFYVREKFRNARIAIQLRDFMVEQCKLAGARFIFSSATAGIGEEKSKTFTKLMCKGGFESIPSGNILIKEL